jgi:hypothetical protein
MASSIGKIESFDDGIEDWPTYVERIEQYFKANDVSDDKRVASLLSLIGSRTYGLLRSLTAPEKPSEKTYQEIVDTLSRHLAPKPLIIAERFRFHKREQRDGETISAFVAEIRKLSQHCEFGAALDLTLRDRLVCGLRNESVQKRLLSEADLTFRRAIDIAVAMETAARDASELQHQRRQEVDVHKMADANKLSNPVSTVKKACYRCNGFHHPNSCRFKDAVCHGCSKPGHIMIACRTTSSTSTPPRRGFYRFRGRNDSRDNRGKEVHNIEDDACNGDECDDTVGAIEIYGHEAVGKTARDHIWINVNINGRKLAMELDTGSGVSLISQSCYNEMFADIPLHPTTVMFKTYTGQKLQPLGVLEVTVDYNDQRCVLNLYVVRCQGPALLGREWLKHIKLDWKALNFVQPMATVSVDTETKLKQLHERYKDIF